MEILARAIPEPLGKFAEWRELSERLKIEGKVQGLRYPSGICVGFFSNGRASHFIAVCFMLLFREVKHSCQSMHVLP